MYSKLLLSSLIFVCFVSCNKLTDKTVRSVVIDVSKATNFDNPLSELFSVERRICLDTNKRKLLKKIDKIEKHNNKYYVLSRFDNKEIYTFDSNGKFLYTIGHYGEGEGSYTMPYDFLIDAQKQEIEVLTPNQIMYYNLADGKFKRLQKIDYAATRFTKNAQVYAFLCGKKQPITFAKHDFSRIMDYLPYQDLHGMLPSQSFMQNDNNLLYFRNFDNKIYQINNDVLEEYAKIEYGTSSEISQEEYKMIQSPEEVFKKLPNKSLSFNIFQETNHHYMFGNIYNNQANVYVQDKNSKKTFKINAQKANNDITNEYSFPMIVGNNNHTLFTYQNMENNKQNTCLTADYTIIELRIKRTP